MVKKNSHTNNNCAIGGTTAAGSSEGNQSISQALKAKDRFAGSRGRVVVGGGGGAFMKTDEVTFRMTKDFVSQIDD